MQDMATKRAPSSSAGGRNPKGGQAERAPTPKRAYRSDRRERQAAQTRTDVLQAAVRLFGERGWAGTTMAAIAAEAGVAVETVYSGFGSKKALLRQAVDVSVVGDDLPIPLAERPEYRRLAEGTREERMRAGVELLSAVHTRTAPVWAAMVEAASGDEEVAGWYRENEARRRVEILNSLTLILGAPLDDATTDLVWALFSTELFTKLVHERGWDVGAYRDAMLRLSSCLVSP